MGLLCIENNAPNWIGYWHHILGLVMIVISISLLIIKQYFYIKHQDKYTVKVDLTFKVSALIVAFVACLLCIL